MKVLLLAGSAFLLLYCVVAEEIKAADILSDDDAKLVADLEDALDIQTRDGSDEPNDGDDDDGDTDIEARALASDMKDVLDAGDQADDSDAVEALKRTLENKAQISSEVDDDAAGSSKQELDESLERDTRWGWSKKCRKRDYSCSSKKKCCKGYSCRKGYMGRYACKPVTVYGSCQRQNRLCSYRPSSSLRCCSGLYCKRRLIRYKYRSGYRYKYKYRWSSLGRCNRKYRG